MPAFHATFFAFDEWNHILAKLFKSTGEPMPGTADKQYQQSLNIKYQITNECMNFALPNTH